MTDSEWMTVSEVSEKVNIPVETIRRYIAKHSVHLRVKKTGKKYLIHDDCMTAIKLIRTLYEQGKNVDEVEETLSTSGIPTTITIKNDDESVTVHVTDELKEIKKALEEQQKFNIELLAQMKKQQEYIDNRLSSIDQRLESRDIKLIESLKATMEVKQQIHQAQLEVASSQKKSWWQRLFNK